MTLEANKIDSISDEEFVNLIKSSLNKKEVLFKLGYTTAGNSWGYTKIKNRMEILHLTSADFKGKQVLANAKAKSIDPQKLFKQNCQHHHCVLLRYIIKNNLLQYKCAICGIKSWQGKTLSLELDHINGINNDNRLENLRFLCPNCHSQTSTFGAKNSSFDSAKFNITKDMEDLVQSEFQNSPNVTHIAKKLGFNRNAVKQIISKLGLNKVNQRYVIQYDSEHNELRRFGSIAETCRWLIDNNKVTTKLYKTCRNTLLRNINKFWCNSFWKIMDA